MKDNCKNCKYNYQTYHCLDCDKYDGKFEELQTIEMSIEEAQKWHDDPDNTWCHGAYLNAKISFKFKDVVLDDDLLEELAEAIADTWNADDYYKKAGENAFYTLIDYDWWDDSYDAGLKESVEREMLEDAERYFSLKEERKILDKGF